VDHSEEPRVALGEERDLVGRRVSKFA